MLHTPLCDLLDIEHPIIQAGMSTYTSPALVAAVTNAGGLGSLGVWRRDVGQLERDLAELRGLTDGKFALNHVVPQLDDAAFTLSLTARPAVISFALDDAGELVKRVHDAGSLAMQQITTVRQAEEAAAHGVDILVAQGGEAGGYGGVVATLALVPQVVDAVHPVPVVAAGGIADGRGFAAALVLGAAGVNIGSRFLACEEAPISAAWKQALVDTPSEEWVQLDFLNVLSPNPGVTGYGTRVRARRNEFTEKWEQRRSELPEVGGELIGELTQAGKEGVDLMMVGGQSAGMITEVLPAAEVVRRLVAEAEDALAAGAALVSR